MIRRTVIALTALLVSSTSQANYRTFQQWSAMSEAYRAAYIAGAFNSGEFSVEGKQAGTGHYDVCLNRAKMSPLQLASNVLSFAKDKPELHTGPVHIALMKYLAAACGEPPTK